MLKIRLREWLYILLLALLLGFSISGFVASLHDRELVPFVSLGLLTAIYIFILSLITTEINNRWIIKFLPEILKTPVSLLLAYLSGFAGALGGYFTNKFIGLAPIELPLSKATSLSAFLGLMTSSLGYLLYKLLLLQRKEEESRRLLLEEQIRNLESQISPHFMFNTLNAIAELIWQDQEKAESSLLSLAKLLRKSLYLEPYITLEEEIDLLKDYWNVISLRFKGQIDLDIEVEDEVLSQKVPKFSLQVLVENALKHGLKLKDGRIKIKAYRKGGRVIVDVEDNGSGFEAIREGVGLKNLRERLRLCGGRLSYWSEEGSTTFRLEFNGM